MDARSEIINKLEAVSITCKETEFSSFGYDVKVELVNSNVRQFASIMLENGFYLVFIAGFHVTPAMTVVYEMASFDGSLRIQASVTVSDLCTVPTISDIYHGAAWHERETRDFFGIDFEGNEDMRPLLLMETDVDFHPLLKKEGQLKSIESVTWAPVPEKTGSTTPAS